MNSLRRLPTAELIRRAWLEICAIPNSWFDRLFSDLFSFYEYPHKEQIKDRVD